MRTTSTSMLLAGAIAAAALSIGCGAGAGSDFVGEPLAVITGKLVQGTPPVDPAPQDVRVALVWLSTAPGELDAHGAPVDGVRFVTQDVEVETKLPASFRLPVLALPPEEAMIGVGGPEGPPKVAIGFLVAYEDYNRNDALDFTPRGATDPVDRAVADWSRYQLVYVEGKFGELPPNAERGIYPQVELQPGFNLLRAEQSQSSDPAYTRLSLDDELSVALEVEPGLMSLLCEGGFDGQHVDDDQGKFIAAEAPFDKLPSESVFTCTENGTEVIASYHETIYPSTCVRHTENHFFEAVIEPGSQPPTNWPCPVP